MEKADKTYSLEEAINSGRNFRQSGSDINYYGSNNKWTTNDVLARYELEPLFLSFDEGEIIDKLSVSISRDCIEEVLTLLGYKDY